MEINQESNDQKKDTENNSERQGAIKQWIQDNMRIIISILIVVVIAGGVYSYSKRTESPNVSSPEDEVIALENKDENENQMEEDGLISEEGAETSMEESTIENNQQEEASSIATSQETEDSFIETAAKGDSRTTLARKALANFLEKNTDSSLTAEHKIYIEDYLRKNIEHSGGINVGTSLEFSKGLIEKAIGQAKTLNEKQLQNLHQYAVRVPSLS